MKQRSLLFSIASLAAVFSFAPCQAATVVSVADGGGTTFANTTEIYATSWTFGVDHTDVSVSAVLGYFGSGRAYLMTDIGPGATVGSQIASVDFTPPSINATTVPLFQNLALTAGTYFLVIQGLDSSGVIWKTGGTTTAAENVTVNEGYNAYGVAEYAPASSFGNTGGQWAYTVTGTAAIPEPATTGFALLSGVFVLVRRRVRRDA